MKKTMDRGANQNMLGLDLFKTISRICSICDLLYSTLVYIIEVFVNIVEIMIVVCKMV